MLFKFAGSTSLAFIGLMSPAHAALPDPVKAMIEAAIESGNDADIQAVAKLAKATNPDDGDEIDTMLAGYNAKKQQLADEALRARTEAPFLHNWTGQTELGAFRNTGNSSNTGLSGGIKLEKDAVDWRVKVRARADYQRSNGVTTREQINAAFEPEYKINDRLFFYGLAQFERNRFQGFSARYTASGGLGYTVIKNDHVTLDVKAGPAWRLTEFVDGETENNIAGLVGLDFGWQIADNLKLTQDAGATVTSEADTFTTANAIFSSGTNTFTATTALDTKLIGALSARFSYAIEHETNPPEGRNKTDTISRASIVYDF